MNNFLLPAYVSIRSFVIVGLHRIDDSERGEGVISAAIADEP